MRKEEIKNYLLKSESLQDRDEMFTALPFYILSGRFSFLSISEAVDIVSEVREEVIEERQRKLEELRAELEEMRASL